MSLHEVAGRRLSGYLVRGGCWIGLSLPAFRDEWTWYCSDAKISCASSKVSIRGCMGMIQFYGESDEIESIATIDRAIALGVTFLDTADIYGINENSFLP